MRYQENRIEIFIIILSILFVVFIGCRGIFASEEKAVKAIWSQGYTDITVVDHSWFAVGLRGCDKEDAARFTVQATNTIGQEIELYVCTGWPFKGGTVRSP